MANFAKYLKNIPLADFKAYSPLFPQRHLKYGGHNRIACTYVIENIYNGRKYVGVTSDFMGRWWQHLNYLRRGCWQANVMLLKDFLKYGEEAFTITLVEQIEDVTKEGMLAAETELAKRYDPDTLYNTHVGKKQHRYSDGTLAISRLELGFQQKRDPRWHRGPQQVGTDWKRFKSCAA